MKNARFVLAAALGLCFAPFVFAATEVTLPAVPVSETSTASSMLRDFGNHMSIKYSATYHGQPMEDLGSEYTLTREGKKTKSPYDRVNFDGDVTAAYMFTKDIGVGPIVPFLMVPVYGQHFILGDVGIKGFQKKTINRNGFVLDSALTLQAPTSKESSDRGMDFAIKATPSVSFTRKSASVGLLTEEKAYLGAEKGKNFKLWFGPYANYALSDKVSLRVLYDIDFRHAIGASKFTKHQTDVCPGVVWFITPKVMVNPYLQVFTGDRISWEKTAFGAYFNAALL